MFQSNAEQQKNEFQLIPLFNYACESFGWRHILGYSDFIFLQRRVNDVLPRRLVVLFRLSVALIKKQQKSIHRLQIDIE